jgi:hypothetical protein
MNSLTFVDPRFWLVIVVVALGSFLMGNGTGYAKATRAAELREARITLEVQTKLAAETTRANGIEQTARIEMAALKTKFDQEIANAQIKHDRLVADIRAGARRVSVPTVATVCISPDTAAAAVAGGFKAETRSELTGPAFEFLNAIAVDGNAAIRRANACADAYAIAEAFIDKLRQEQTP